MSTQIFDDGSTLTTDDVTGALSATNAPDSYLLGYNNTAQGFASPSAFNPNASSWNDVLAYGFARLVDAGSRKLAQDNTIPLYQQQQAAIAASRTNTLFWLIVAGVAIYALK